MSEFILKNFQMIVHNNKFKNYVIIYFVIFCILFGIIVAMIINNNEFMRLINDETNRNIIITDYEKFSDVQEILNFYDEDLVKVEYSILEYNFVIDNEKYNLSAMDSFNEEEYSAKVHFGKPLFKINDLDISKTIYDSNLDKNQIVVNQKLAKYLYEKKYIKNITIILEIENYFKIDEISKKIETYHITYNKNNDISENLIANKSLQYIMNIFFMGTLVIMIVIIILFSIIFMFEKKKELKVFHSVGYAYSFLIMIYILNVSSLLLMIYLICGTIFSILVLLLIQVFEIKVLSNIVALFLLPIVSVLISNCIGCVIGSVILKKGLY